MYPNFCVIYLICIIGFVECMNKLYIYNYNHVFIISIYCKITYALKALQELCENYFKNYLKKQKNILWDFWINTGCSNKQ